MPITWATATLGGRAAMLRRAVNDIAAATGLEFVETALSADGAPAADIADITITITDRAGGQFAEGAVGVARYVFRSTTSGPRISDVRIFLDATYIDARPEQLVVLAEHELGHAVGLGHVEDASQVMAPRLAQTPLEGFGEGDLAGLALVGRQPGECGAPERRS